MGLPDPVEILFASYVKKKRERSDMGRILKMLKIESFFSGTI